MKILLVFFGAFSVLPFFFDNNWLLWNSYYFYVLQFSVLSIYLISKVKFVSFLFVPTLVMFFYLGLSFSLGSYLVPKGVGFLTDYYIEDVKKIDNYSTIVFFYLNVFNVLFYLSCLTLKRQIKFSSVLCFYPKNESFKLFFALVFLFIVSLKDFFFQFGMQVGIISYILLVCAKSSNVTKAFVYCYVLAIVLAFNHHNKREVMMGLMLILLAYSTINKERFNIFSARIFSYFGIFILLVSLVISASILRGYGNFEVASFWQAITYIPDYIKLPIFQDIIVDNFEISHTYPASILPVEYLLIDKINILAGVTLIKPMFLIIPREVWESKPDSIIAVFTNAHSPGLFDRGISIPISLPAELFLNFHIFSFLILFIVGYFFNRVFESFVFCTRSFFKKSLCLSITILFFILVRGSGFDLFVLTALSSALILLVFNVHRFRLRI